MGWLNRPVAPETKCSHLGRALAELQIHLHPEGHKWQCSCGDVFVVVSGNNGRRLVPWSGKVQG